MSHDETKDNLMQTIDEIYTAQSSLHLDLLTIETLLESFLKSMELLEKEIAEKKQEATNATSDVGSRGGGAQKTEHGIADESVHDMEKLLHASLDSFGDKLSARLSDMIKDLHNATGHDRVTVIHNIQQAAASENVDLSSFFQYKKIDSNVEGVGIKEKEAKGISNNLEILRKMRQQEKKKSSNAEEEKE